jgi:hypothetical protein
MPRSCSSDDMNAAFMQFDPQARHPGGGRHHATGATPATGALRTPSVTVSGGQPGQPGHPHAGNAGTSIVKNR